MKDSEFIELLNLYLDHEITAADAARLEAEVQSHPDRRRIYQDYCRMQKACKVLAKDFADDPVEAPDRKVVAFEQARTAQRRRGIATYVGGSLAAAAACVAIIVVGRGQRTADVPSASAVPAPVAITAPAPSASAAMVATATPAPGRRGLERQSLNSLSLRNGATDGLAVAARVQNDPQFAWIQGVNLAPIQSRTTAEQVQLDVTPAVRTDRTYSSSNKPQPADIQSIAFRFQR